MCLEHSTSVSIWQDNRVLKTLIQHSNWMCLELWSDVSIWQDNMVFTTLIQHSNWSCLEHSSSVSKWQDNWAFTTQIQHSNWRNLEHSSSSVSRWQDNRVCSAEQLRALQLKNLSCVKEWLFGTWKIWALKLKLIKIYIVTWVSC